MMGERHPLSRREILGAACGLAGTGVLIAAGAVVLDATQQKQESLKGEEFDTKLVSMREAIEVQGVKMEVARMTASHNYLCTFGERLYQTDKDLYWSLFSEEMQGAGPEAGHHTPKFWEEIITVMGNPNLPLGNTGVQLVDRLNQHSAHFGELGDVQERAKRIRQLEILHGFRSSPAAGSLVTFERLQLERDIGLFYLQTQQLAGDRRPELAEKTGEIIAAWSGQLRESVTGMEEASQVASQVNPFA